MKLITGNNFCKLLPQSGTAVRYIIYNEGGIMGQASRAAARGANLTRTLKHKSLLTGNQFQ
jgi:hypothetical protein